MKTKHFYPKTALLFLLLFTLFNPVVKAQRDSNSVVIIVPTTPSLSDGRKLEVMPQISRSTNITKPNFTFQTLEKFSKTDKHIVLLDPLSHTPDKRAALPNGYGGVGYGNLNAFRANIFVANNANPYNSYGFKGNHFSTNVPKSNKDFSRNEIGAFTKLFKGHNEFGVSFDFERNAYRFFNLPDSVENVSKKDVTRNIEQWNVNIYYKSGDINHAGIKPYLRGDFDFEKFVVTGNQFENNFTGTGHLRLEHNNFLIPDMGKMVPLDIKLKAEINQVSILNEASLNRYFAWLEAHEQYEFMFMGKKIEIDLGLKAAVYADTLEPEAFIMPDLHLKMPLLEDKIVLLIGLDGDYDRQSYQSLFTMNPFMQNRPRMENKFMPYRAYGGVNAQIAPGASFLFEASTAQVNNMALFVGSDDPFRRFDLRFDNGTHTKLAGQLNFNLGDKLWANLLASYNIYNMEREEEAWLLPDYEAKLRVHYTMAKKLFARLDILSLGNRKVLDENNEILNLNPLIDLNLGADFHIGKSLYTFAQFNNIANTMYQRWYQFPVYGFNFQIGAGMRF